MNSLVESYPELLEEWNYEKNNFTPSEISYGSRKKLWWKCKKGHEWQATPNSRTYGNRGCPFCSGYKASEKNNIALIHPELLKEWDYEKNTVKPENVSYGSNKKFWWKCKEGHSWQVSPNVRIFKKTGCPKCFNSKLLKENNLSITHPELATEWDYEKNKIKPEEISYGSNKKFWWKCKKGHSWEAAVYARTLDKNKCGQCKIKKE